MPELIGDLLIDMYVTYNSRNDVSFGSRNRV